MLNGDEVEERSRNSTFRAGEVTRNEEWQGALLEVTPYTRLMLLMNICCNIIQSLFIRP